MRVLLLFLVTTCLIGCASASTVEEVDAWHATRVERLKAEDGWLSLVGLFALPDGVSRFGSAEECESRLDLTSAPVIARFEVSGGVVRMEAVADLTVDGEPVEEIVLAADISGAPTVVRDGRLLFYLIERNGRPYLRVKDTRSELVEHFEGIDRWPVQSQWQVDARWEPSGTLRTMRVPSVLGYDELVAVSGEVVFEWKGETHRLTPSSFEEDSMFFVFGDATNGVESYGGGRFLVSGVPDEAGRLTLDFNRSYNPPCVFTPFATCPLPPAENRLDFEVLAGEKMWGELH